MRDINIDQVDWEKGDGLVPAVIQDVHNGHVLMLGYMNQAALCRTLNSGKVTFFSRSKNRLWTKGETSGNWIDYVRGEIDCDADTILIHARPHGPVCHTGSISCFNNIAPDNTQFLGQLGMLIADRHAAMPAGSYDGTGHLLSKATTAQRCLGVHFQSCANQAAARSPAAAQRHHCLSCPSLNRSWLKRTGGTIHQGRRQP